MQRLKGFLSGSVAMMLAVAIACMAHAALAADDLEKAAESSTNAEPTIFDGLWEEHAPSDDEGLIPAVIGWISDFLPGGDDSSSQTGTTATTAADHGLWYECLGNQAQQEAYDLLLEGLRSHAETIPLGECTNDDATAVYLAVHGDHPEIFWTGSEYTTNLWSDGTVEVVPEYTVSDEEAAKLQSKIDKVVKKALSDLPKQASDYDKVKYCYEWIINNTDYRSGERDQNIQSVFLDHVSVCAGYSRALQYLLRQVDVRCDYVTGTVAGDENHAWCIVWIDGTAPTYVDVTWGDPTYNADDGSTVAAGLTYDYLCVTSYEMTDHRATGPQGELPACTSTDYDYYRLGGCYLESFDGERLQELLQEAWDAGDASVRIKLGNREAYDEALAYVTSQSLYDGVLGNLGEGSQLSYSTNVEGDEQPPMYFIGLAW